MHHRNGKQNHGFENVKKNFFDSALHIYKECGMSVKIKVSYQERAELDRVLKLLRPVMKGYKISGNEEGKYKKAYIEIK